VEESKGKERINPFKNGGGMLIEDETIGKRKEYIALCYDLS